MSAEPLVTIGLVLWNSAEHLASCLAGMRAQTYPSCELIVVDNASADGSLSFLTPYDASARTVRNTSNLGFARAHNQAIALAQGQYYLALNPDVVMEPGYISALVCALEQCVDCGMAGGKLLLDPVLIDSTGLFL